MKCATCGADRAQESSFCSNCGSALDPAASGTQVGHTSLNRGNGRIFRHVLLGVLGGFWLGLAFIGALLVFVPRERRADRLFGAWLGMATSVLLLVVIIAAAATTKGGGESEAQAAPAGPTRTAPEVLATIGELAPDACVPQSRYPGIRLEAKFSTGPTYYSPAGAWYAGCAYSGDMPTRFSCVYVDDASLETTASSTPWEQCEHGLYGWKNR